MIKYMYIKFFLFIFYLSIFMFFFSFFFSFKFILLVCVFLNWLPQFFFSFFSFNFVFVFFFNFIINKLYYICFIFIFTFIVLLFVYLFIFRYISLVLWVSEDSIMEESFDYPPTFKYLDLIEHKQLIFRNLFTTADFSEVPIYGFYLFSLQSDSSNWELYDISEGNNTVSVFFIYSIVCVHYLNNELIRRLFHIIEFMIGFYVYYFLLICMTYYLTLQYFAGVQYSYFSGGSLWDIFINSGIYFL